MTGNLKSEYLEAYELNDFFFIGGWSFFTDRTDSVYLLGENGCHIILSKTMVEDIKQKHPNDDLKFVLTQFGLGKLKDSPKVIDTYEEYHSKGLYVLPSFFLIDVTKACNLDCIYCFRDLNDTRRIDINVLQDICSFICDIVRAGNQEYVSIQMWGGEPLMALDSIRFVYRYFTDRDIIPHISIETNGTLMDEETAGELKKMNVSVGISIDGTPEHQNRQRRLVRYHDKSSMDLVQNGINALRKHYGRDSFGVITVITKYNYSDIDRILEYFIHDIDIHNAKFNIVKDNPNAAETSLELTPEMIQEFSARLYELVVLYNMLGTEFHEANIIQRARNLTSRNNGNCCDSNGCKGGYSIISFDMKGDIYPCELTDQKVLKIGSVYDRNKVLNGTKITDMVNNTREKVPYFQKKDLSGCKDCPWIYFCKGGCSSRLLYSGNRLKTDEAACIYNKEIYPRLILDILERPYVIERLIK